MILLLTSYVILLLIFVILSLAILIIQLKQNKLHYEKRQELFNFINYKLSNISKNKSKFKKDFSDIKLTHQIIELICYYAAHREEKFLQELEDCLLNDNKRI